ncbi:MAG: LysM peptidoglycan-binding domain-containing protein [Staphylococcus equorum]|uniref:COG3942 and LysM peptidoglycan-binding domain-containing protein n=1 Tax=Staphylococcus TaxID=1279 RepID=UPI000852C0FC|nr:CHAP domain-containing protein [Staphylococcus equorum]MDG0821739.1 LysM peptidoglycan-binding domain-containing protein [Staphylococcus equorum]MDK9871963.1 LysM peptidoglycan-binding domain-containing protein [Staphylococcus equorum]MDK9876929.1 LysM peptidoglycan-binding domain-containing protein [Staphylococcus equorum]MDN5829816.1 LysM peptidoglycan-binding domain-containing protein [Staphylococcus equorum]MDN5907429.1 LysM peptidoglycan-binding domain-containing protein [Staphylococcu
MKKGLTFSVTSAALFFGFNGIASADQIHTVKEDAKLSDIAQAFATTTNEIQSLNQLNDKVTVQAGEQLVLPDKDIVEIKQGDTVLNIAAKYQLNLEQLYQLNPNLGEIIYPGQLVAVSEKGSAHLNNQLQSVFNEQQVQNETREDNDVPVTSNNFVPTTQHTWDYVEKEAANNQNESTQMYSNQYKPTQVASNGSNYYDWGQCTYYAFDRRQQLGKSVGNLWGNANNWASAASNSGYKVNRTPEVGAIFQSNAGNYGHVGVVERKNPDGSIVVSEMNWQGVGQKSYRTIHNTDQYNYIH